ncbi:uncharacterized protein TNCV_1083181 [Trichonephila clavipes]|nr:uncharacterized protein TNCV_1083181 [Trichonephila clavipes]
MAHSERSTSPATRCVDQPAVFIPMIRPLSNSLNCERCLLARLPGMFRLPKSSYNRRENGTWRRRLNFQLYQSYKESDIVNFIKIQQIEWAARVVRLDEDRTTKRDFNAQPNGTRRKGRPNLRWIDGLEKDLLVWRTLAGRRLA